MGHVFHVSDPHSVSLSFVPADKVEIAPTDHCVVMPWESKRKKDLCSLACGDQNGET